MELYGLFLPKGQIVAFISSPISSNTLGEPPHPIASEMPGEPRMTEYSSAVCSVRGTEKVLEGLEPRPHC